MAWYDGLYKTVQKAAWPAVGVATLWMGFNALGGCAGKERVHLNGTGPYGRYEISTSGLKETNPVFRRPEYQDKNADKTAKPLESEVESLQSKVSGN